MMEKLIKQIQKIYPEFPDKVVCDFAHLLDGNTKHIPQTRERRKDVRFNHAEQMIGFGTGFDWLHLVNFALIVNPFALDLKHPLATSGKVLLENLMEERIEKEKGVVVMISTSYRNISDRRHSEHKAKELAEYAYEILQESYPKLFDFNVKFLVGTMDVNTRLFVPLQLNTNASSLLTTNIPKEYFETNQIAEFIIDHNKKQSDEFIDPYQTDLRKVYRNEHPTEIMALKCMDGRMNLPLITGVPMGIIQPMRNIGAKFSIGWKALYDELKSWKEYAMAQKGRKCLIFTTYHFSDTDPHLGCAGHEYDTDKARQSALMLANEIRNVFGEGKDAFVNVAVIGVNTDDDSIIVHGRNGESFTTAEFVDEVAESEVCA